MITEIPTMLTIKETAQKLGLSDYYLRGLVRANKIVYVKVGAKYLINLEKLIEYLNAGDNTADNTPDKTEYCGTVRRIVV